MVTFQQDKGKTIQAAFEAFDQQNPRVWELFQRFTQEAVRMGKAKTSAKLIINRIRWEVWMQTKTEDFKINDAFASRYARKFAAEFPHLSHLFNYRKIRSI